MEIWPHSFARGLPRTVSDHCPILMETKFVDWGPKPFRFINAWTSHPDFARIVSESWNKEGISGWSSYVYKEKLKRLKTDLKCWNRNCFGLIEENIAKLRTEIEEWDVVDDTLGLEESESIKRNAAAANLLLQFKNRDSLLSQKARDRWLADGDVNSSYFHRMIKGRRAKNSLSGLLLNDRWVDEPSQVKKAVREHFEGQFKQRRGFRLSLPEDFVQKKLSRESRESLEHLFTEEEVKAAIWNCE
ncbi:uncharacterized protein LOC131025560 [Salvia miltiorrhiza]|uniref:uncharacterized protein LOC131025560 n=1 Tax=Salvia miltiorrhiza TaxID=226208 RepID=UPI0025AC1D18|nr:uncharacterized protein LOC131025560 [Salvia miltiorrhiza]